MPKIEARRAMQIPTPDFKMITLLLPEWNDPHCEDEALRVTILYEDALGESSCKIVSYAAAEATIKGIYPGFKTIKPVIAMLRKSVKLIGINGHKRNSDGK